MSLPPNAYGAIYLLTNLLSSVAIVFANKVVLSVIGFKYTVALTFIHTATTWLAARAACAIGFIPRKRLPRRSVVALALSFTGYIVLCNVSLLLNTVGFYQLTKIAIAPAVMIMQAVANKQAPDVSVTACVLVVCVGIGLATVFDTQVSTNFPGLVVGVLSVIVSAQYGIWIGGMAKHHEVTPLQLLEQYIPYASLMMGICVPIESVVMWLSSPRAVTLFAFPYSVTALAAIAASAILGVLVTFSTFLVIGYTSPLTYAIAGHAKTVVIISGGIWIFGDQVGSVKLFGIGLAMCGVIAYTRIQVSKASRQVAEK